MSSFQVDSIVVLFNVNSIGVSFQVVRVVVSFQVDSIVVSCPQDDSKYLRCCGTSHSLLVPLVLALSVILVVLGNSLFLLRTCQRQLLVNFSRLNLVVD